MRIWGTPRPLDALLTRFRPTFSSSQYGHFRRYVAGLVLAPSPRTVLGISRLYLDPYDQSVLSRFLADARWSRGRLARMRRMLIRDLADTQKTQEEFFIVDDTTLERACSHSVEAAGIHYTGTGKNCRVHGHCIVTSHLLAGELFLPLDLRLYDKRRTAARYTLHGKIALACDLVRRYRSARGRKTIFLADSWYFCCSMVDAVRRRGWDWIFAIHSNRVAWVHGNPMKISHLQRQTALAASSAPGTRSGPSWGTECVLPGIGRVQLVFWRLRSGGKTRSLVTNRLNWSPKAVIARYANRGRVEMFYWACKQSLGLGEYRVRTAAAAIAHWQCVFCAYTVLVALDRARPRKRRLGTIGRISEWLAEQTFVGNLQRAYTLGRVGGAWSLARCAEEPALYLTAVDS